MTIRTPAWLQAGTYPAENDRYTLQALVSTSGVAGAGSFQVTPNSGMVLNVAAGWANVLGTAGYGTGSYVVYSDAATTVTIGSNSSGNPRIDLVVLTVNDAAYSGSSNNAVLSVVQGTPAGSPTAPATPNNSIALAQIAVANGASTIGSGQITDVRTTAGTSLAGAYTASNGVTAPIKLTAGTNLITPVSGALEYDGASFYATAVAGSGRAALNGSHYFIVNGDRTLALQTGIQNLFATAGNLTLAANETYEYEMLVRVSVTASVGSPKPTITMLTGASVASHTAVIDFYGSNSAYTTAAAFTTASLTGTATNSIAQDLTTGLSGTTYSTAKVRGVIRVSASTTLTPSVTFNAGTITGAKLYADSFIKVTPVGSNTVTSIGAWS